MMLRFVVALFIAMFGATAANAQCATAFPHPALLAQVATSFPDQTTGFVTPSDMRTFQDNLIMSMQSYPGVNNQFGATYTILPQDYGQFVNFNNASPIAVTLSAANAVGFCPFAFFVNNIGLGLVTITPQSGTIGGGATYTLTTNSGAYVVSDGTNWQVLNFKVGSVTINGGTTNQLGYYATTGTAISGLTTCNNGVYETDGSGVPSCSSTLPSGLTYPSPVLTGAVIGPDAGTWSSSGLNSVVIGQVQPLAGSFTTLTFGVLDPISLGTSPTTVSGLTVNNTPNSSNDYVPYFNASSNTIERATVGSIGAAGVSGVASLNGLVGGLAIVAGTNITVTPSGSNVTIGETNSALTLGSTSMALGSTTGTIAGPLTFSGALTLGSALTYGGVTLSNSVIGTGAMALSTNPVFPVNVTAGNLLTGNALRINTGTVNIALGSATGTDYVCWNNTNAALTFGITCTTSDERLKTNWENAPGLLSIMELHPGSFEWLDRDQAKQGRRIGLAAQDVEKIIPQVVSTGGPTTITLADGTQKTIDDIKSIKYDALVVPLINAVQTLAWICVALFLMIAFLIYRQIHLGRRVRRLQAANA